jgi:hypothetical protein
MISKSLFFVGKLGGIAPGLLILTTSFKKANQEGVISITQSLPRKERRE